MLLDRSGVLMGLPFPAGRFLDEAAVACSTPDPVYPISVKEGWFNLSGLENVAQAQLDKGSAHDEIAVGLLSAVSRSVGKALITAMEVTGLQRVLFSGGVSASQYLRHYLNHHQHYKKMNAVFCPGKYSVDNAVGIAFMGVKLKAR
jgi:N6-L-threonylcarbamoyladenine synthase